MRRYCSGPGACFDWLCDKPEDFQQRPGGWPETRYEAKARAQGHEVWYFKFRRIRAVGVENRFIAMVYLRHASTLIFSAR
jgi:hypothetical protein